MRGQHHILCGFLADQFQHRFDQHFAGAGGVLRHRSQGRDRIVGNRDIVEADHADLFRHRHTRFGQGTQGADGEQVAGGEYRIKTLAAGQQALRGLVADLFGRIHRINLQLTLEFHLGLLQGLGVSAIAIGEFRAAFGDIADKGNRLAPQ